MCDGYCAAQPGHFLQITTGSQPKKPASQRASLELAAMCFLVYRLKLKAQPSGRTRWYTGAYEVPRRFGQDFQAAALARATEHVNASSGRGAWWCRGCVLDGEPEVLTVIAERSRLNSLRFATREEMLAALSDRRDPARCDDSRGGPFCSAVSTPEEDAALAELLQWPQQQLRTAPPWDFPPVVRRFLLSLCFRCGALGPSDGGHWASQCPAQSFLDEPSPCELAASPFPVHKPDPAPKAKSKTKAKPKAMPKAKPKVLVKPKPAATGPDVTGCGRVSTSAGLRGPAEERPREYGVRWRKGGGSTSGSYFWYEPAPRVRRTLFVEQTDAGGWRVRGTHPLGDVSLTFDPLERDQAVAAAGLLAEELALLSGCTRRRSYKRGRSPSP